jgi:hypothetical protein
MVVSGDITLRKEFIDTAVKAVALREYKLRTLCTVDSSSAYTESYWRETNTDPTSVGVATIANGKLKGTPALAPFTYGSVAWTKVTGINEKYAVEGMISYEDEQLNYLPMIERTVLRLGRGVAKAVDDQIAAVMLASAGNTFAITAGNEWDSATIANQNPVFDLLYAVDMIRKDNLDALNGDGYLVVNGTDYINIMNNSKVFNNPTFKTASVVENGVVGEIAGLKIMVTESLEVSTPDVAYVVIKGAAMVWKSVTPLTIQQIVDPGIKTTIRAWEIGHCQMVSPNAVCKITNTRK